MNITLNQFKQLDNDFIRFCKENNCIDKAYTTLTEIYNTLEKTYICEDFDVIDDFNNNIISIDHIEEKADVHVCNTCYDYHKGCICMKEPCTVKLPQEVLKIACQTIDGTGSSYGFFKHVCKDIVIFFRTPFARSDEF